MAAEQSSYPDPLPWSHRAAAMPWFPGGNDGQLSALRVILNAAKAGTTDDTTISLGEGIPNGISLRVAGKQLQPTGLLKRANHGRWATSAAADAWLASGDGCLFNRGPAFQDQIRGRASANAAGVSSDTFGSQQRGGCQVRPGVVDGRSGKATNRLARSAGVVELKFDNTLRLTETGELLLPRLQVAEPFRQAERVVQTAEAPIPADWVSTALIASAESLSSRKPVIGYIPGAADDAIETLRRLVTAASPSITRMEFDRFCEAEYAIKPSSAATSLALLRGAGLVEQVAADAFAPTPQALEWLSSGDNLDFMCWLHTRFLFFLEIIPTLETASQPANWQRWPKPHTVFLAKTSWRCGSV